MFFSSFNIASILASVYGCLAVVDWTRAVDRIIDEMSPAYLFVVLLIGTGARLAYRYFVKKIDSMADKDEVFLTIIQDSLSTISQLEDLFKSINKKLDKLLRELETGKERKNSDKDDTSN